MSNSRDRQNVLGLLKLLGRVPPPPERKQPLMIVAPAAGGSAGGGSPDVILAATSLTAGKVYRMLSETWGLVDDEASAAGLTGVALSETEIQVAGVIEREGTPGATVYADASGDLTETDPGTPTVHDGPWVTVVGYQLDEDRMLVVPELPYRPQEMKFCGEDGTTSYTIIVHEYAA